MAVFQMICFIKDTIQSAMGILCGKKVPHVAAFRGIAPGEGGTTTRGPVATISKVTVFNYKTFGSSLFQQMIFFYFSDLCH